MAYKRRAQKMYDKLVTAIDASPLTILYASDSGLRRRSLRPSLWAASARACPQTPHAEDV